ncbi:hypothetical protein Pfo_019899 [Paulownia fortunei]|nr:hypothetical protein Pfo_019899 [Paulownia fortunei]
MAAECVSRITCRTIHFMEHLGLKLGFWFSSDPQITKNCTREMILIEYITADSIIQPLNSSHITDRPAFITHLHSIPSGPTLALHHPILSLLRSHLPPLAPPQRRLRNPRKTHQNLP